MRQPVFTVPDGGKLLTLVKDGPDWAASIVCCDCGLAHNIRIGMHRGGLAFRAWRNGRLTKQVRAITAAKEKPKP